MEGLELHGLLPNNLLLQLPLTLFTSNTVGNVSLIIFLTQFWPNPPQGALYGLALLSSLAANLLLMGSLSTLIAMERAARLGIKVTFGDFAKVGIPVTLLSMAFAVAWLGYWGWLPWLPSGWALPGG
jgi:Na+/H+ antiporter NhaD/arsenite permease-like protein